MSNISVNTITDASGGSTASINGLTPQASNMQPFNRIINGAMTIDQRNAGAAVTANNAYSVDRFKQEYSGSGATSLQQSTDAPEGFAYSLKATVTTADASLGASSFYQIMHSIEGYNISDIRLGNSLCKEMSLSFWVKASQTGTYPFQLSNPAGTRCYPISVAINTSNTWEYKTINISATTSGTFLGGNLNGLMLRMAFGFGANFIGATPNLWGDFSGYLVSFPTTTNNMMATSGATFYITGVQLEAGSSASPFAHENYGDTLRKCQRYYERVSYDTHRTVCASAYYNTIDSYGAFLFYQKRSLPTFSVSAASALKVYANGGTKTSTSVNFQDAATSSIRLNVGITPSTNPQGHGCWVEFVDAAGYFEIDAEL